MREKRGATGDAEADLNSSDMNLDDPEKNNGIAGAAATFEQDSNYKAD